MLTTKQKSLSFYQPSMPGNNQEKRSYYTTALMTSPISSDVFSTVVSTDRYYNQYYSYVDYNDRIQSELLNKTTEFVNKRINEGYTSASMLRDKANWNAVKRFVTREELMKLQVGAKVRLPLPKSEIDRIKEIITDKDLTALDDKELNGIIDEIVSPDQRKYMEALKNFKSFGRNSHLLRQDRLERLKDELSKIDLDKITSNKFQSILRKYCERHEYHHRNSVSRNPSSQSNANNIEIDNSTQHDKRHTPQNGDNKVNYKVPTKDTYLDRNKEIYRANNRRVLKNEITGLGIVAAVGVGVGFTIGFATSLAQAGITPDTLRNSIVEGGKMGVSAGLQSAISYGIGRTVGQIATMQAQGVLSNAGVMITDNVAKMINMGVVGAITITVFSLWQIVKLINAGNSLKTAMITMGRQALFSMSLLAVSIVAQGVWGGPAGIIVSTSIGILVIAYGLADTVHKRTFSEQIRVYAINKCKPEWAT